MTVGVLGGTLLVAAVSQVLVHFGRHRSYAELLQALKLGPGSLVRELAENAFLWLATYTFPLWLAALLSLLDVGRPGNGLALALAAPLYVGLGYYLQRVRHSYRLPLYSAGYALTILGILLALGDNATLTAVLCLNTALFVSSAWVARQPAWLYPALVTTHGALYTFLLATGWFQPARFITLPFLALTWLLAVAAYGLSRVIPASAQKKGGLRLPVLTEVSLNSPSLTYLTSLSGVQPLLVAIFLDLLIWQMVALGGYDTTLILAVGHAILLAFLASLWQDELLAALAPMFVLLAVESQLHATGLPFSGLVAWLTVLGFALYLIAVTVTQIRVRLLRVWSRPLTAVAAGSATVGVAFQPLLTPEATGDASLALAFAGALYLAIAYRKRLYWLGYLAGALIEIAWVLALLSWEVGQPQFYAIPAGLYFAGIGVLERGHGRTYYANYLEGLGLSILLLTTFIQSLDTGSGLAYFLWLLFEAAFVIVWGGLRRIKVPFFAGIAATVLNVVGQLVLLATVNDVLRWVVILGTGLLFIAAAILVERERERLAQQFDDWREALETWQ